MKRSTSGTSRNAAMKGASEYPGATQPCTSIQRCQTITHNVVCCRQPGTLTDIHCRRRFAVSAISSS